MFELCKYCSSPIRIVNSTYELVECINCNLIFSRKIFSQLELQETYDRLYNDKSPQYKIHSVVEFEELLKGNIKIGYNKKRFLKRYLKGNSKVLEIGSGVGLIGSYIQQNFPDGSYTGVELDMETNEKAKSFGLNVHQGDFSIMDDLEGDFDVILMWEVLEHIQDLRKCISLINKKLVKGGVFIFSVPNYDKRLNYPTPKEKLFTSGPPIHLNFFRKQNIYKIFQDANWEIKEFKKKKIPYINFEGIKKHFFQILLGKFEGPTIYCVVRKKC